MATDTKLKNPEQPASIAHATPSLDDLRAAGAPNWTLSAAATAVDAAAFPARGGRPITIEDLDEFVLSGEPNVSTSHSYGSSSTQLTGIAWPFGPTSYSHAPFLESPLPMIAITK
ncbi:MAG: hypothetical protein ACR2OU_13310 [Thermomicrobiales bacterium]